MELKTYFAQDVSGNIIPNAQVFVYLAGTTTPASGIVDQDGAPLTNPFNADSSAAVVFAAPDGDYDVKCSGASRTVTIRAQLFDGGAFKSDLAAPSGSDLVGFKQSGTGAVSRTAQAKLREVVSVKDFGAVGDGITNDAPAFALAIAASGCVYVPEGVYNLGNTNITAGSQPVRIFGAGIGKSVLKWTGAAGGITFASNTATACEIEGLSLIQAGQAVGTAIKYDGAGQVSGGVIQQRTSPRMRVSNVAIHGSTASNVDGWECHVHMKDAIHCTVENVHMIGHYGAGGMSDIRSTYGIRIEETPNVGAVEFMISGVTAYFVGAGLHLFGCEGVMADKCNFVNVTNGINATSVLQLSFTGSHINSFDTGIIGGITQSNVSGNLLYGNTGATEITLLDIQGGRSHNTISGNTFVKVAARNTTAIKIGASATTNTIIGNIFRSVDVAIDNAGANTNAPVNTFSSVTTQVAGAGTFDPVSMYSPAIELCGGSSVNPYIDFKNGFSDDADCRIQQSVNGLLFQVGGNGSLVPRLSLTGTGGVIFRPPSSAQSLSTNGDLSLEFTNNTTVTIRARGSDGTTRSGTITLA